MADPGERTAIEELKARYCRLLDTKDWDGFAALFTADFVLDTAGSGGRRVVGRDEAVAMVRGSIDDAVTVHQVHSPELRFTAADAAEGIWAMQDRVIWSAARARAVGFAALTGWGHYHERYRRGPDGGWRIAASRLERLHLELQPLPEPGPGPA